jgi:CO dehydrogenase maturation factor
MHATVRSVLEAASGAADDVCILDTEASPEHLSRGTAQYAETMLIVVEPYYKSLETGRRMALLGRDLGIPRVALVGNKLTDEREVHAVREFASRHGIELAGFVPFDEGLPESERAEQAPLDFAPDGPAVAAIAELGRELARDGRA